eukprot:jgi/Botrbrau1/23428/Bobra.0051s0069.1
MASPNAKRAKVAVNDGSACVVFQTSLRMSRDHFLSSAVFDSQHQFWLDRAKNKKLWDVVIRTDDDHETLCSKKDLANFSDYFLSMFSNENYREADCNDVTLMNTNGSDFEVLVSLYYSREKAPLTSSNLLGVYGLAKRYQFIAASSICEKLMADNLNPSNVLDILILKYQIGAYGAECAEPFLNYAATCESVMADLEKLLHLPLDVLADILRRDDICLSSEQQVLEVIKAWCLQAIPDREGFTGDRVVTIPDELWKCLWLHVADEEFLGKLLNDSSLFLTAAQLLEAGKAAVVLSSHRGSSWLIPSSRSTLTFHCTIQAQSVYRTDPFCSERVQATMCHGSQSWLIHIDGLNFNNDFNNFNDFNNETNYLILSEPEDRNNGSCKSWMRHFVKVDIQFRRFGKGDFEKPSWLPAAIRKLERKYPNMRGSRIASNGIPLLVLEEDKIREFEALRVSVVLSSSLLEASKEDKP